MLFRLAENLLTSFLAAVTSGSWMLTQRINASRFSRCSQRCAALRSRAILPGCRVKVGDQVKFACVDGPEFDAHAVDFDDLIARLRRFTRSETAALERWQESCRVAAG